MHEALIAAVDGGDGGERGVAGYWAGLRGIHGITFSPRDFHHGYTPRYSDNRQLFLKEERAEHLIQRTEK